MDIQHNVIVIKNAITSMMLGFYFMLMILIVIVYYNFMKLNLKINYISFVLFGIFLLTTAFHCEPVRPEPLPIEELKDAKAFATITPVKDVYRVGDTIKCVLKINKSDWNNWKGFSSAIYSTFILFDNNNNDGRYLSPLLDISKMDNSIVSHNNETYLEQIVYYKLLESKNYLLGVRFRDLSENKNLDYDTFLDVVYQDDNATYRQMVPVYFTNNNQRYITLNVVE